VDKFSNLEPHFDLESDSISVSQLNKLAKTLLENNMPVFWVKGEVSGLKIYNHAYFDLKDESGKISCVIFARTLALADFKIDNGQQIEVRGRVTIYQANGSYQINVERIRMLGVGDLWEAYQRLINKLTSEGLFDKRYKKPLPVFPQTIGLVTSKEGAVIRDVITTLKRRMPNITIIVYHTLVQGSEAGMQIAKSIRTANVRNEVDVLIVCRGGGSINDLWAFNEEVVAREVFASHIPLISAVGHETDTTIIDFVSDLRAPTPTAAAELVAKSRDEWNTKIHKLKSELQGVMEYIINNYVQRLDLYYAKLRALSPQNRLRERSSLIKSLNERLTTNFKQLLKNRQNSLINIEREMDLLNPRNILSRGYAIVRNKRGNVVFGSKDVAHNERISVLLHDDAISAIVDKKHQNNQEELI
jgi:exodeoxyribonuclease VII large subunit